MQRKGARARGGGAEQDVEAVLDRLYTTPPSDFVARREELAAAARTAGRGDDARRIHEAHRPTLAAWAANLLLRSRPRESRQFLELGQALREAHRDLDSAGVKELSAQRRRIVAALSRQAAELALDAGHRLSDTVLGDVTATLQAVLADPEAADRWATGRLDSALAPPSGFPSGIASEGAARSRTPSSAASAPPARPPQEDGLARRREERLGRARRAAEAATRELGDRRAEHADAETSVQQARDRRSRAQQEVDEAERRLREAREALRQAAREEQPAEERYRAAADALARAERDARQAAREVERLERTPAR
ncbi:hypothetical protein ACIBVL_31310 [Streptomyces sp. NPDC049687]|uniref:hypothetical protein n=1 Tax=Streptomyces sp. NPDC049687 TaxID=3365596 RepID=UPI00378AE547